MENINDMQLFSKVVELKSFTAVAEVMHLSRSLISKRIARLEDQLGVQLIHRTTRRLQLTEAGRTYYQYCVQVEQTIQEAEAAVSEIRRQPRGKLSINASVTFGQLVLADIVADFLQQYPDINIELGLDDKFIDLLEGGFDVAIRIGQLKDSSLKARKIGSTRLRAFAHNQYLEKHGIPVKPADLLQHNCLSNSALNDEWQYNSRDGVQTVQVSGNFHSHNGIPLLHAAKTGLGITLLPEFMLHGIEQQDMRFVLESYFNIEIGIYAIYPYSKKPPLNTRVFIDYLAERFTRAAP